MIAKIPNAKIQELLERGVEEKIKSEDITAKLASGKRLRIKHGVDPTTPDLHLGYSVVYLKLRELQDIGHKVIFLIGDFTARFGDPTQKTETRTLRDKKEVEAMAKNYIRQAGKILDLGKLEIRRNGEWYDKMSAAELLKLMAHVTERRMIERDMFQERINKGMDVRLHELVYPLLQGYDSVMLKSDLTVCGRDQIFNELIGRQLQEDFGQHPQDIIAMKILVGTDGRQKMSQSIGNYIGITESAQEQYGKIMSIPDTLIGQYFELTTRVNSEEVEKIKKGLEGGHVNPRDLKARLAREIVTMYHGDKQAISAEKEFINRFREHKLPSDIMEGKIREGKWNILDLLVRLELAVSKSEAKRLVEQGGVKIDNKQMHDWRKDVWIQKGMIIQIGRRQFRRIA